MDLVAEHQRSWWLDLPREGFTATARREFALRPPEKLPKWDTESFLEMVASDIEAEEREA